MHLQMARDEHPTASGACLSDPNLSALFLYKKMVLGAPGSHGFWVRPGCWRRNLSPGLVAHSPSFLKNSSSSDTFARQHDENCRELLRVIIINEKNTFIYRVLIICLLSKLQSFNSHTFLRQSLWFHHSPLVWEQQRREVKYWPRSHVC